jgi:outer membrane receptor protein involved in Fe transport
VRGGFNLAPLTFSTSQDFGDRIVTGTVYTNPVNLFRAQGRTTDTYNLMENAGYLRGRHVVQLGFQIQSIRVETFDDSGITPAYYLGIGINNPGLRPDQLPGISASDFVAANDLLASLGGYVVGYSQTFNVTSRSSGFVGGATSRRHYTLSNYALYVQDKWKLTPRLTLNLGLRYELQSVVDERDSLSLLPILQNGDPVATLLSNSTLDFAGSSAGRPWYGQDKNNFAPNVGFAWDVFGDGTTALRGAYSISYVNDETIRAILNNVSHNEGLTATAARTGLSGRVGTNLPSIPVPT